MRTNSRIALFVTLLTLFALVTGCSTASDPAPPAGPSDEELIQQHIDAAFNALAGGDIAGLMAAYSSDMTWDQGGYDEMNAFMTQAKDAGFLDGFESDMSAVVIAVDGDTATVTGASVEGAFGVLSLSFELEKRDGAWIITQQSQQ